MTTTVDKQELRDRVKAAIKRERNHIVEVAETIRTNPEFQFDRLHLRCPRSSSVASIDLGIPDSTPKDPPGTFPNDS